MSDKNLKAILYQQGDIRLVSFYESFDLRLLISFLKLNLHLKSFVSLNAEKTLKKADCRIRNSVNEKSASYAELWNEFMVCRRLWSF